MNAPRGQPHTPRWGKRSPTWNDYWWYEPNPAPKHQLKLYELTMFVNRAQKRGNKKKPKRWLSKHR